jgi:hypothetical protein
MAVLATLALAAPAWATEGEHEISVGAAASSLGGAMLAGADARWLYDLTDFWAIGAGLHDRWAWGHLPLGVQAATFEGRFVLDALQWIPSIGAGVGVGVVSNAGPSFTGVPWAHLDVGVDYRPSRKWAIGVRIGMEGDVRNRTTFGWVGGLYWNWYGGKGIGLDL